MKQFEMDMTSGSLWKKIWVFSVPLMFSNVIQVLFNLSDLAVIGKFDGPIGLGAIGSTAILITLYLGLVMGFGNGVNARTAWYIGSGEKRKLTETVFSGFMLCLINGILVCLIGILLAEPILYLLNTKEELMMDAVLYLRIYLTGIPALALYNYGNAVLSACGDTKRPLYILAFSGVLNVIMNLFFVIVFKMGVAGVGLASSLSSYLSAILVLRLLLKKNPDGESLLKLDKDYWNKDVAIGIVRIGLPTSLQYAIFAFANLFVQQGVNSFDHVMVEGNSAAANADGLLYDMMAAFYTGCSSFIAQNYGAHKKDRMLKTYGICLVYSAGIGFLLGMLLYLFRIPFLSLFTNDEMVVASGLHRIRVMAFSYGVSAFMDCTVAASRGIGKAIWPSIFVILGSCVFRIIWIYTVFAYFHTIQSLYLLYVFSWTLTSAAEIWYFFRCYRKIGAETPKNR